MVPATKSLCALAPGGGHSDVSRSDEIAICPLPSSSPSIKARPARVPSSTTPRHFENSAARRRRLRSTIPSLAGWSTMPARSGRRLPRLFRARCKTRRSRRNTSPASASPTSGKRSFSGTAAAASRWGGPSSGKIAGPAISAASIGKSKPGFGERPGWFSIPISPQRNLAGVLEHDPRAAPPPTKGEIAVRDHRFLAHLEPYGRAHPRHRCHQCLANALI